MIYEVCALVLTIILGMLGLYFIFFLHSTRSLVEETRQTVKSLNEELPTILHDLKYSAEKLRSTTETVEGGIHEVATSIEVLTSSPLRVANAALELVKRSLEIWYKLRGENHGVKNQGS